MTKRNFTALVLSAIICAVPALGDYINENADFVAVQYTGSESADWNFGLYSEDGKNPFVTGDGNPSAGVATFWELTYDGTGSLTYSWGTSPDALKYSISNSLFNEDFNYLTITTGALKPKPNEKTTVSDLVLETDLGVLYGDDLYSASADDSTFTFTYDNLQTFGAFTLSGSTIFDWPGTYKNSYDMGVVIQAGNNSPVVSEPASGAIVLIGLIALAVKAKSRRTRASFNASPSPA